MRTETGQAVLAATGHLGDGGPPLSSLIGRLAASQGLPTMAVAAGTSEPKTIGRPLPALLPAVGDAHPRVHLLNSPTAERQPTSGGRGQGLPTVTGRVPDVVLMAAHGGAGVSSLLRAGLAAAGAVDGQRRWPAAGRMLLVARTSTGALERARDLTRAHARGQAGPDVELVGLVLVADAPGRLPARISALADLVSGAFARCWQVPWLTEWRLAAASEPLPVHPEVARLSADLRALNTTPTTTPGLTTDLTGAGPALQADRNRPDLSRGVLL
jgi:hypothetical protein